MWMSDARSRSAWVMIICTTCDDRRVLADCLGPEFGGLAAQHVAAPRSSCTRETTPAQGAVAEADRAPHLGLAARPRGSTWPSGGLAESFRGRHRPGRRRRPATRSLVDDQWHRARVRRAVGSGSRSSASCCGVTERRSIGRHIEQRRPTPGRARPRRARLAGRVPARVADPAGSRAPRAPRSCCWPVIRPRARRSSAEPGLVGRQWGDLRGAGRLGSVAGRRSGARVSRGLSRPQRARPHPPAGRRPRATDVPLRAGTGCARPRPRS